MSKNHQIKSLILSFCTEFLPLFGNFFSSAGKVFFFPIMERNILITTVNVQFLTFQGDFFSSGDVDNDDDESKTQNFLAPSKEFTIVDVILLHMIVQETNDVESRSDFDDALLDM